MGSDLPVALRPWQHTWSLIRGSTLWRIWIRRNAVVFRNDPWSLDRMEKVIWDAIVDLARISWARVQWSVRN